MELGVSDLPSGWHWTLLGDIAMVAGGITKDSKRETDPAFVEVPYLTVANVQRGYLDLRVVKSIRVPLDKLAQLRLRPGDILFNEGGDRDKLGRGWVWSGQLEPCIHQNHVLRARLTTDQIEPRWISWFANSIGQAWFDSHGKQTTNLASLSLSTLRRLPVPVPPLDEQRTIVEALERQLSRLDAALNSLHLARARLQQLRALALEQLLSSSSRSRQLRTTRTVGDLLDRIEAGKSFKCAERPARDGEWGVIKVSAMTWGAFRADQNKTVTDPSKVNTDFEIRQGDLLMSRANTVEYVGAVVLVDQCPPRLLLSDKSLRLVPKPNIDPSFLLLALRGGEVRRQIEEGATGTSDSMRNLSQDKVRSIKLQVPDAVIQRRIVLEWSRASTGFDALQQALNRATTRAEQLRRTLFGAAFTGRLVDPIDGDQDGSPWNPTFAELPA